MDNQEYEIYNALAGNTAPADENDFRETPENGSDKQNRKDNRQLFKGIFIGAGIVVAIVAAVVLINYASIKSTINKMNEAVAELERLQGDVEDTSVDVSQTLLSNILDTDTINKMIKIYKYINASYLHEFETEEVQDSLIQGFVSGLGDKYTAYYTVEETTALMESINGTFYGIGVLMQEDLSTGYCIVLKAYKDSPAYEAGIRDGDIIYKVDGEEMFNQDTTYIATRIRGEEGTDVEISVVRGSRELEFTCTRALITEQTVDSRVLEGNVGYISVSAFETITYDQFKEHFDDIMTQNVSGLIIDLRSNGGGDVDTTVKMLDELMGEGIALYMIDKNGERKDYNTTGNDDIGIPVTVLVNQYSASASEIFTGCLRDRLGASIVGVTTYGKGVVQSMVDLGDETLLKITIAEYFTPSGYQVNGQGIVPDVEVEDDYETEDDEQLDRALSVTLENIANE